MATRHHENDVVGHKTKDSWQAALQEATDLRNNLPRDPPLMTGRLQVSELLFDGVRIDAGNPAISPWVAAVGDVYDNWSPVVPMGRLGSEVFEAFISSPAALVEHQPANERSDT